MRIAISGAGKDWRGTETDTLLLALGLKARGHEVVVFCRPASAIEGRIRADVGTEAVLSAHDFDPLSITRCVRALRKHGTQLVVIQKDKDLRLTGIAARLLGIPVLVRHVTDRPLKKGLRYRLLFGKVATHHLANSTSSLLTLRASAPWLDAEVPVIHNGIDVSRYANAKKARLDLPDDAFRVGFVGAFELRKGIIDFAHAWRVISTRLPRAWAVIAGQGARENEFRQAMQGLPRVRWLGFRSDIPNVMKALDVFVLPSRFEGFGLVLTEAMAAGIAAVAYDTSNLPELVTSGEHGLLVPLGDTNALADAVVRLATDHELRLALGSAAQKRAANDFSAERMVAAHERLFHQIIHGEGHGFRQSAAS